MRKTRTGRKILHADIQHRVIQSPSHKKLQRQIYHEPHTSTGRTVYSFRVFGSIGLVSLVPSNKQSISHCKRSGMIRGKIIEIEHTPCQRGVDMAHDFPLKILLGLELVERKALPQAACFRRDAGCQHLDLFLAVARRCSRVMAGTDWHARLR